MSRLIDWESVCLVCLKKGENRSIFERDNDSNVIADKVMKCAHIFVEKDTDQPKSICLQCLHNLNVTYKFNRNYEQSDSIIKALLSTNHKEFQIKDLWKTTPFRGAQQKESLQRPIPHIEESANSNEINIKHEIIENDLVDDTHDNDNSPCIAFGDNIDAEAKFVPKDPAEACFQGSAIELNDLKANKSNKICGICNGAYKHLKIHMRRHNKELRFSCDRCDKAYVSSGELRLHMRGHTGEKPYECQYCDRRFAEKAIRKNHERTHTGEKPFVCPTCGKRYTHSGSLSQHRRSHTGQRKVRNKPGRKECNKTDQDANDEISGRLRNESKTSIGNFCDKPSRKTIYKKALKICEICNRAYKCQALLDIHMRRHNNERPFSCDHCDKAYMTSGDLRRHIRGHTGEKPYGCQYCDRRFAEKSHRQNHERTHTGERPFVCPTCGKSFTYSTVLAEHRRIHSAVKRFMCEQCDKGFDRRLLLERHVCHYPTRDKLNKSSEQKQKKVLEKEIFQIEECAKSNEINIKHEIIENDVIDDTHDNDTSPYIDLGHNFDTEAKLALKDPAEAGFQGGAIELNDLKANESNRMCGICNRAYKHLKIHMRRHNKELPFRCDHCDKAFMIPSLLRRHMRAHTGEKPYKCQYCDRCFTQNGQRKTHERTHTGERPFVCPTCGKSFTYSHALSEHLRIHTGVKKFKCEKCGKGFNKRARLEKHVARHLNRDKLDKSSEHKQKKVLEKEIFQIEECAKSNEINIKHEVKLIEEEIN